MNTQPISLENSFLRLVFDQPDGFALEIQQGGQWWRLGRRSPLTQVIYRDAQGARQVLALPAQPVEAAPGRLALEGVHTDPDGVEWRFTAVFSLAEDARQVKVEYRLETSQNRAILQWIGPGLAAGEGSFGGAKDEALFPGLEYLLDDEPSSDTRFAAEKYARRGVPHPYKITVPLMAVSHGGRAVGIMWDPNQDWHSAWRHPAARFASPDTLAPSVDLPEADRPPAGRHQMAIFAPAVEPRWLNEGEMEAHTPCDIAPGHPWQLSAWLVGAPEGGVLAILRSWVETYGLPDLPLRADYRANAGLCARSFLEVAWDAAAEGWHHTLSDPWGPRYEPNVANLLWRYGRWSQGEPGMRAQAREVVRRGVQSQKNPTGKPHLDLALAYGEVGAALDLAREAAQKAMAGQQADGSWPWDPQAVGGGGLKTQARLEIMGRAGDSATGFTASAARPVLQYALATGDPQAVDSLRRAADWCNAQRRPEGAQAWELHLHVPDVLAVPHLIQLNLGMFRLTGGAAYLEAANRWAWTGLPFTYLWNAYYRPIMRYGTVPVFGVTFHDIQPWFGVIVQWNGLVYATALLDLAAFQPADGPMDWRKLAEGIIQHGMQEQVDFGPFLGMYPDAFSPVKGDEEYTWWLNPQLLAINTFRLAGLPVLPEPVVLRGEDGRHEPEGRLHLTSGARIVHAQGRPGESAQALLADEPGEPSYTLAAGAGKPSQVVCEGQPLPETEDLDAVPQGWQWNETHHAAIIKTCQPAEEYRLEVKW